MTVRRGTLYSGVFLIATGATLLGVAVGVLDANAVASTVGTMWPVAVIAVGVGLVLRRSRAALGAGILAAGVTGLALSASIVALPDLPDRWADDAWVVRNGSAWESSWCDSAPFKAGLAVDAGAGSVTIYPEGVCK